MPRRAEQEPKQMPMVGWYNPKQLAKTGVEVAVSTLFGRHSDHRLVEAMAAGDDEEEFYDYSVYYEDDGEELVRPDPNRPRNEIWIDYVGDVGDGWNPTYAIAYYVALPEIIFSYTDPETRAPDTAETKRGAVLVFGGDEVYPTASREEYERRLVAPYATAFRDSGQDCPHVFAIPGNHDWYDSLVAFTRLFTARPWFAGWRTRQDRSYFALKLPHNWWLLGTDLQLGSDIDKPQMDYFHELKTRMDDEAARTNEPTRIIVCHAEPHWIRAAQYEDEDPNYNESNLKLLEKRLGKDVAVFIAGDLHHYRRHESEDQSTQKITAGGGGAFLHPTHYGRYGKSLDEIVEKDLLENEERTFTLEGCFPLPEESSRICWRNLLFPFFIFQRNQSWSFGLVIAALYLLLTLPIIASVDELVLRGEHEFGEITFIVIQSLIHSPLSIVVILLTVLGFIFFTDTHSFRYKLIMGGVHGIAHVVAACVIGVLTVSAIADLTSPETWTLNIPWPDSSFFVSVDLRLIVAAVLIFVLAFLVGSFIMGLYLLISLNVFGRHSNEAFSSLGIEDWKHFLRLHIDKNGDLSIYPIGIRRVPRKWKPRNPEHGPELVPKDSRATKPELIEPPIEMKKDPSTKTGCKASRPKRHSKRSQH